jgi:hypothetical protein
MNPRAAAEDPKTKDGTVALNTTRTMIAVVQEGQESASVRAMFAVRPTERGPE